MKKEKLTEQKLKAFWASESPFAAPISAGWTPGDLRAVEKDWASIPVLNRPYTQLLADIESGRRKHDQKTFGPESNPPKNICGTAMCTAGHLVNMAGEVGYKLKDKYGWTVVAGMIHMKSRPDAPAPNFWPIPQELAMAYIRERAQEEADQ